LFSPHRDRPVSWTGGHDCKPVTTTGFGHATPYHSERRAKEAGGARPQGFGGVDHPDMSREREILARSSQMRDNPCGIVGGVSPAVQTCPAAALCCGFGTSVDGDACEEA